jgi:hypothetical protein
LFQEVEQGDVTVEFLESELVLPVEYLRGFAIDLCTDAEQTGGDLRGTVDVRVPLRGVGVDGLVGDEAVAVYLDAKFRWQSEEREWWADLRLFVSLELFFVP